ncbi:MAG: hypothetical protein GY853_13030 [PVC group bacterium]|nr:hypothetical protein [PVC group bacterium]
MVFKYQARDKKGKLIEGKEEAGNRGAIIDELRGRGYFPISVEEAGRETKRFKFSAFKVNDYELVFFTRQLFNLLDSGVALVKSLNILSGQTKGQEFKKIVSKLHIMVSEGSYFYEALTQYPEIFSGVYRGMVEAGEKGGNLERVLGNLADFMEQKKDIKDVMFSMLIYPVIIMLVGAGTVLFLMMFVVPKMFFIFSEMRETLPLATKILINSSSFLSKYWAILLFLFSIIGLILHKMCLQEQRRLIMDKFLYELPIIGESLQKMIFSRFSYVLSMLLSNGMPILESMEIGQQMIQNRVIRERLKEVHLKVSQGSSLSVSLTESRLFPSVMVDMIYVGEETGKLDQTLLKIAHIYEKESRQELKRFLSLLEPGLILFVALVVGFLVMAMLLPLLQFNLEIV